MDKLQFIDIFQRDKANCNGRGEELFNWQKEKNRELSRKRVLVENVFSELKRFKCLEFVWRHNHEFHFIVFNVICKLNNMRHL